MNHFVRKLEFDILKLEMDNKLPYNKGIELTKNQHSEEWLCHRQFRLTSSKFGKVFKRKKVKNLSSFVFNNFFKTNNHIMKLPAIKHGNDMEAKVIAEYKKLIVTPKIQTRSGRQVSNQKSNLSRSSDISGKLSPDQTNPGIGIDIKDTPQNLLEVVETGVWTRKEYFYLGGSPDALLINSKTGEILKSVEIKCPFYGKELSIKDLIMSKKESGKYSQFYLKMDEDTQ
jgi:hypothetical protein